jgi:hypothetical protein
MKINVPDGLRGMNLLDTPLWNKGTAFNDDERIAFALEGLLPPQVESIQEQSARAYEAYKAKTSDLERHIYLRTSGRFEQSHLRLLMGSRGKRRKRV